MSVHFSSVELRRPVRSVGKKHRCTDKRPPDKKHQAGFSVKFFLQIKCTFF